MKATPKLQDTLEVFVDQIEGLKETINQSKTVSIFLHKRIEELKTIKIEPDLRQLNESKNKLISDFSKESNTLEKLLQQNYSKLEELQMKRKGEFSKYPFYLLITFFTTIGALYFGINNQQSKSKLQEDYISLKSYNNSLEQYIKESKQIDNYNKWMSQKYSK